MYLRAQRAISGGNMLLSKHPDRFLPEAWPGYFKDAKGCLITDLDGVEYTDLCIMGIGTNILGYSHPEVDEAVTEAVRNGNMSTFNAPEEVELAEKLIELNPWASKVKFARSGGEINSIAVRIARAATGRSKVILCGYHGWHDWYLATNIENKSNLNQHIVPGLAPTGVPKELAGTALTFNYNDLDMLEKLLSSNQGTIAAIKMEVKRNSEPECGFLEGVKNLAQKFGAVLIFDECTSGFRETFGGVFNHYQVVPDIAVFAKALGNGYAVSACVGTEEVMQAAANSFISSTFWTERIGSVAALKTLQIMEREQSWERITNLGSYFRSKMSEASARFNIDINFQGMRALTTYSFGSKFDQKYKTLITQEMLKKKILASNMIYFSISHNEEMLDNYIEAIQPCLEIIARCENGDDIDRYLEFGAASVGFGRLN